MSESAQSLSSLEESASASISEAVGSRPTYQLQDLSHPEPPASPGVRAVAGLIAIGSLALLLIAASLVPFETGIGTHTQLGFPSCRWVTNLGLPCPTCGMTTAYTNLVHGNILEGFLSQPFGFILAIGTGIAFWISTLVLLTGSHVYRCVTALWKPSVVWSLAILAFLSWAFKIWRMTSSGEFG